MKKLSFLFCVFILALIGIPIVSAKAYGWGFKRNNEHRQPDIGIYAREIAGTSSYYVGPDNEKVVYLTFDAGYDNGVLPQILDVLAEKDVRSTFFVTGDFLTRESCLLLRMVYEGHTIGNHSWSHRDITTLSASELERELAQVEAAYTELTGLPMKRLFRPPAGQFNRESLMKVKDLGYRTIFWSVAYKDWETNRQKSQDYAYEQVMGNLHNGAIILLHTVSQTNLEALPRIIDGIRNEGYQIKNLDYLLKN